MDQDTSAPVSVDTSESFERDYSDLDIPGYEDERETPQPAATEETVEAEAAEADDYDAVAPPAQAVDEKAQEAAAAKVAAGEAKKLAFKLGDGKSVELVEDAVVEWKVDGKQTPVPLKELLQNYSGKVAWEKRFNEVAEQRKQMAEVSRSFESERMRHSKAITDMHKAASEGRTFDAVTAMLQLTNTKQSPREYIANLRNGLTKQATELAKLTPEQRQAFEDREEIAYLKSETAQTAQQREQEQAQKAFHERVVKAITSVNSTSEEFVNTREWLRENGPRIEGRAWDPDKLTPEFVAAQIRDTRDYRTAKEALDSVDPELVKNESTWKQAVDMLRSNPDWTAEDVKDVYREAIKAKRSAAISKKVAKAPTATAAKASAVGKQGKKASREDFSSFDEADASWD
jgi:hypothetical protein